MRIAIIDMGTNTFHLMVAEVFSSSYNIIRKERVAVKIGEKGITKNEITPDAWDRAVDTIQKFKQIIDNSEIDKVFATATSAIRNAKNGGDLVNEIKLKTGISSQVISGTKEAELILSGVKNALDLGDQKNLIMDIGGGSIEFIIANRNHTFWLQSFEVGGQRLVEKFHHTDPIAVDEVENLRAYFNDQLAELYTQSGIHQPKTLIGCSGTFDTLSDIYCEEKGIVRSDHDTEYSLPLDSFNEIHQDIVTKTRAERLVIPGMIEMRVDMIVVACILIDHLITTLGIAELRVSAYALKEGVLLDAINQVQGSINSN